MNNGIWLTYKLKEKILSMCYGELLWMIKKVGGSLEILFVPARLLNIWIKGFTEQETVNISVRERARKSVCQLRR